MRARYCCSYDESVVGAKDVAYADPDVTSAYNEGSGQDGGCPEDGYSLWAPVFVYVVAAQVVELLGGHVASMGGPPSQLQRICCKPD